MDVKLFANLAEIADDRTISVDGDGASTVGDVLEATFAAHPALREEVLDGDDQLAEHINVLVDGTTVPSGPDGLEYPIDSAEEIAIFPPVSGG